MRSRLLSRAVASSGGKRRNKKTTKRQISEMNGVTRSQGDEQRAKPKRRGIDGDNAHLRRLPWATPHAEIAPCHACARSSGISAGCGKKDEPSPPHSAAHRVTGSGKGGNQEPVCRSQSHLQVSLWL